MNFTFGKLVAVLENTIVPSVWRIFYTLEHDIDIRRIKV